jgi:hypothetical protein
MKPLREQIVDRITILGGEEAETYEDYSDYDLLEDYENLLRTKIEAEYAKENLDVKLDE